MKRKLNLVLFVIIFNGLIFSQSIQVITPKTGVTWYIGDTVAITWKSVNLKDTQVKINIFREKIVQANFVEQLTGPDNGSKQWTIGSSFKPGKYILRVKGATSNVTGDSGIFNIAVKPTPPPPPGSGNITVIPGTFGQTQQIDQNQLKLKHPPTNMHSIQKHFKPDLAVKKVIINAVEPLPEGIGHITADIVLINYGKADVPKGKVFTVIILNAKGDPELGINFGDGLKAGDIALVKNMKFPVRYEYRHLGEIHYFVWLDYEGGVDELDEMNNRHYFSVKLQKNDGPGIFSELKKD